MRARLQASLRVEKTNPRASLLRMSGYRRCCKWAPFSEHRSAVVVAKDLEGLNFAKHCSYMRSTLEHRVFLAGLDWAVESAYHYGAAGPCPSPSLCMDMFWLVAFSSRLHSRGFCSLVRVVHHAE
eukprot:scaffold1772_cov112-Isochrysis_galbana.AAC.5